MHYFLCFNFFSWKLISFLNQSNHQNTKNTTKFEPVTTPQQNTRKQTVRKTNKKGGKKKEVNLPKPLPSFSFFRPLLVLLLTTIYINKIYVPLQSCNTTRKKLFK